MNLTFDAVSETRPGQKWRTLFDQAWPGWRDWQRRASDSRPPTVRECERALKRHMPEFLGVWNDLVQVAGGGQEEARFLSFWCPPRYLAACSQVAGMDADGPFLIRNYDLDPVLSEATILHSAWKGRKVIATVEGIAGAADGVNDRGLAVSITFGGRPTRGRGFGIPLIVRYVLEVCGNTKEAIEVLRAIPCHMAYNVTVMDKNGAYATVYLSPDRPAIVTTDRATTNHQLGVEWPAHGARTRTLLRREFLDSKIADGCVTAGWARETFLKAPLYNSQWEEGFGTVYTALYRPGQGTVELLWPGHEPWQNSLQHFVEGSRSVAYLSDGKISPEVPEGWVAEIRRQHLGSMLAIWEKFLPPGFAKSLSDLVNNRGSQRWADLGRYWSNCEGPKQASDPRN